LAQDTEPKQMQKNTTQETNKMTNMHPTNKIGVESRCSRRISGFCVL